MRAGWCRVRPHGPEGYARAEKRCRSPPESSRAEQRGAGRKRSHRAPRCEAPTNGSTSSPKRRQRASCRRSLKAVHANEFSEISSAKVARGEGARSGGVVVPKLGGLHQSRVCQAAHQTPWSRRVGPTEHDLTRSWASTEKSKVPCVSWVSTETTLQFTGTAPRQRRDVRLVASSFLRGARGSRWGVLSIAVDHLDFRESGLDAFGKGERDRWRRRANGGADLRVGMVEESVCVPALGCDSNAANERKPTESACVHRTPSETVAISSTRQEVVDE